MVLSKYYNDTLQHFCKSCRVFSQTISENNNNGRLFCCKIVNIFISLKLLCFVAVGGRIRILEKYHKNVQICHQCHGPFTSQTMRKPRYLQWLKETGTAAQWWLLAFLYLSVTPTCAHFVSNWTCFIFHHIYVYLVAMQRLTHSEPLSVVCNNHLALNCDIT